MCAMSLCVKDDVIITNPLTWHAECVYGRCDDCATPSIEIPQNIRKVKVTYSSWQKGERVQEKKSMKKCSDAKKKGKEIKAKVFGLFPITDT